jgi:hypothetical protein
LGAISSLSQDIYEQEDISLRTELASPLKDAMHDLSAECKVQIEHLKTFIEKQRRDVLFNTHKLQSLLNHFDEKRQQFIEQNQNMKIKSWDAVFRVYFYIYSFREFVEELKNLLQYINGFKAVYKTLHFPSRFAGFQLKKPCKCCFHFNH